MASIIWKGIYVLTNKAAEHLVAEGKINPCPVDHGHDGLTVYEIPVYHPASEPADWMVLEWVKSAHKAVGDA